MIADNASMLCVGCVGCGEWVEVVEKKRGSGEID